MKVFFGCDTKDIIKYASIYKSIRQAILDTNNSITRDWLISAIKAAEKDEDYPESQLYDKVVEAILAASVVIIEGTVATANIGHELTLALQKGKQVLFLSQLPNEELKKGFLSGIDSPLLTIKSYAAEKVKDIVEDFLRKSEGGAKVRFNLVMDKDQDNYLEWAAYSYEKSKTEVIKNGIDLLINKDEKYKEYLHSH